MRGVWQALIAGQEFQTQSADVFWFVLGGFFGDDFFFFFFAMEGVRSVEWQLLQLPASADVALLRLLTSLALVFYYLIVTESRGREKKGCSAADEARRQPAESPGADKVVQKVLAEVAAAGFTEKKSSTTIVYSFAKRLLSCRAPKSRVVGHLCGNNRPSVTSRPSSRWITWLEFRPGCCPSVGLACRPACRMKPANQRRRSSLLPSRLRTMADHSARRERVSIGPAKTANRLWYLLNKQKRSWIESKSNRICCLSAFLQAETWFSVLAGGAENQARAADMCPPVRRWRIGSCDVPALLWAHLTPNQLRIRCLLKFLGGWRFPAALKHITAQLVDSRPGKVGVDFHWFHIAEVVLSSCAYHLEVFIGFTLTIPFQTEN